MREEDEACITFEYKFYQAMSEGKTLNQSLKLYVLLLFRGNFAKYTNFTVYKFDMLSKELIILLGVTFWAKSIDFT